MWLTALFISLSIFFLAIYSVVIILFYLGWKKIPVHISVKASVELSVVIAARNEGDNIAFLLSDIVVQDYPKEKFEVIVVDDGSEDQTINEALHFQDKLPLRVIRKQHEGKKAAINKGVGEAKHELIVTTDADCRVPVGWLTTIASYYEKEKPAMIIAPVKKNGNDGFFDSFQTLDLYSMVASGAGASWWKNPILCNGANLTFQKSEFLSLNDPSNKKTPSGDDVFLMLNLKAKKKKILFLKSPEATVTTMPQLSWKDFFRQRFRWTSKSRFYRDKDIIAVAVVLLMTNLLMVLAFAGAIICPCFALIGAGMFLIKMIVDFPLVWSYCRFTEQKRLMKWYVPVQLIYPIYISFVGITGQFVSVSWKNKLS
jgi:poly-beta-1,6-N-acetyl-D-glucosamine synthase